MADELDFEKQGGLITAIVQDAATQRVLMVGYMNREAFEKLCNRAMSRFSAAPGKSCGRRARVPVTTSI